MSYQVRYTDRINTTPITVDDNTVDETTSLQFPGRNTTGYGQAIGENFLHLLENFANTSAPVNPVKGQLWYDSNVGVKQLKIWDGTTWSAAGGLKKGAAEPQVSSSLPGDLWVNTDTQQLFLFTGSGWILVGPNISSGERTGAEPEILYDTLNNMHYVVSQYAAGERVAIISKAAFKPKAALSGFSQIYAGVTLNSDYNGFFGVAEKASALLIGAETVAAENFLRGDKISNSTKALNIKSNDGISVGSDGQLQLAVDGATSVIYQKTSGSNLDIRVNNNGLERTVIRVDSSEKVGINNTNPQEALDVIGSIKLSANSSFPDTTGILSILGTVDSTSTTTGSLVVAGGAGIGKSLSIGETLTVNNIIVNSSIVPDFDKDASLGTSTRRFSAIYADAVDVTPDGVFRGTLQGTLQGNATGSATRLASATIFEIVGDITSNEIEFDGQTGVNPINTTSASGNGTTVTLTFAPQTVAPFPSGSVIVVTNITPTQYRGTYTVISGTNSSVTYASTATGAQVIAGTISPSGTIGNRKRFISNLSESFILEKPEIEEVANFGEGDEFLVSQGAEGLKKIKKSVMWQAISQVPVGSVMPYAGLSAPKGWLLCDGSEVKRSDYPALFQAIGFAYGNPLIPYDPVTNPFGLRGYNTFRLPDLRGRFALGADNMNNNILVPNKDDLTELIPTIDSTAGRVSDPRASIDPADTTAVRIGAGSESVVLTVNNLPDHEHDLKGDNGGRFFAYRDSVGSDTNVRAAKGLGGANNAGEFLGTSGGVLTEPEGGPFSQAINLMNPFMAMQYIIYTGQDI